MSANAYTRRLEHQLYLARAHPEPTFDISDCDLKAVPSGVYSVCKVLQKESLLLKNNKLESLDGGGNLRDLFSISLLDLSFNRIKELSNEFAVSLSSLRKLNLRGNKLRSLPTNMNCLKALVELDLRENPKLGKLPSTLFDCPNLRQILLDESHPDYFSAQNLPRNHHNDATILSNSDATAKKAGGLDMGELEKNVRNVIERRSREREELRQSVVDGAMEACEGPAFDYAARDRQRASLVHDLFVEDERASAEMRHLLEVKRDEQARFSASIIQEEATVRSLIERILAANDAARRADQNAIDTDERRFYHNLPLVDLRVRRDEITAHMRAELQRSERLAELLQQHTMRQHTDAVRAARSHAEQDSQMINTALSQRDQQHQQLVGAILEDQEVQKSMFEELQRARDVTCRRLVDEIAQVQAQLLRLSVLDAERRQLADETQRRVLEEQRTQLVALLEQLLAAKTKREAQLRQLLAELETQRSNEQVDFWLVQYQRLLDTTPDALLSKMFDLSQVIVDVLFEAAAEDFIPLFKRHRITEQQFLELTDSDLKALGVALVGTRKSILLQIQRYRSSKDKCHDEKADTPARRSEPSAPQPPPEVQAETMTTALRVSLECCVCLDSRCDTVFLSCGHVCTCRSCATSISVCPLCRQSVSQKLPLIFTA